jgi:hypothetical protein
VLDGGVDPITLQPTTFTPNARDDEDQHWYVQVGIERNFFGPGKSTIYAEYYKSEAGAGLDNGAVRVVPAGDALVNGVSDAVIASSETQVWGFGFVQSIDAAAMDLYIGFRNYSGEVTLEGAAGTFETDIEDFQVVMAGGLIKF